MKYPWMIHIVSDNTLKDGMVDAHTHGLDKYDSLELQFVICCENSAIAYLLNAVGDMVRNGMQLEDGQLIEGVCYDGAKLKVFKTKDDFGEDIFRIILPDGQFRFPEDSDEWPYNLQYESPYKEKISKYN